MVRKWVLVWSSREPLGEDRSQEFARAILQRFREDGSDRMDVREISRVGTESFTVATQRIGSERSRVEIRRLDRRSENAGEDVHQVSYLVTGLRDRAEVSWSVGDLAEDRVDLQGDLTFAREVAHLFDRIHGFRAHVEEGAP